MTRRREKSIDYQRIWNQQQISPALEAGLASISQAVNDDLLNTPQGISNISEWAKRDGCWARLLTSIDDFEQLMHTALKDELVSIDDSNSDAKNAKQTQKVDNGIEAQKKVFAIAPSEWTRIQNALSAKNLLSPKELGILAVATKMPSKIPTEKQCAVLIEILGKAQREGVA